MRVNGYLEILGCIGLMGWTSWCRCKAKGIPFTKDPKTRGVWSTSEEVLAWWGKEQAVVSAGRAETCRKHRVWGKKRMRMVREETHDA